MPATEACPFNTGVLHPSPDGVSVFAYPVRDPERYGVVDAIALMDQLRPRALRTRA